MASITIDPEATRSTVPTPAAVTRPTTAGRPAVAVSPRRLPRGEFGEAFLVWRCATCGATGDLRAFPSACPDCGSERELLYYYTED